MASICKVNFVSDQMVSPIKDLVKNLTNFKVSKIGQRKSLPSRKCKIIQQNEIEEKTLQNDAEISTKSDKKAENRRSLPSRKCKITEADAEIFAKFEEKVEITQNKNGRKSLPERKSKVNKIIFDCQCTKIVQNELKVELKNILEP